MMAAAHASEDKHPPDYRRHELEKKKNPFPHPGDIKFYVEYEVMRQNTTLWIHQLPFPTRLLGLLRFPVSSRFSYTASSLPTRPIAFRALTNPPYPAKTHGSVHLVQLSSMIFFDVGVRP
jgi:hypothetical protein